MSAPPLSSVEIIGTESSVGLADSASMTKQLAVAGLEYPLSCCDDTTNQTQRASESQSVRPTPGGKG